MDDFTIFMLVVLVILAIGVVSAVVKMGLDYVRWLEENEERRR